MISLRTAKNTVFPLSWIGVSDFDGSLRFEVTEGDMGTLFTVFSDPEHTRILTRVYDEDEKTYTGYTRFKGLEQMATGGIVVRLLPADASYFAPAPAFAPQSAQPSAKPAPPATQPVA